MPKRTGRRTTKKTSPPKKKKPKEGGVRLQKVLAAGGLGSRRQCEALILAGRVDVDRKVVTEMGTKVDPSRSLIRVDGVPLRRPLLVYYALNKPTGVVCTNQDPAGRPRAIDLVPAKENERLFTIGRLDLNSEGLILVTNDGDLSERLTHPRYRVPKRYQVMVAGHLTPQTAAKLRRGVRLAEGIAHAVDVKIKRKYKNSTVLEIVLEEGRNREVRRILAKVGHKVLRLVRTAIGPVRLGKLAPGESRRLNQKEIASLARFHATGL